MLSFVVPAYNEERLLGRTLASLHAAARTLGLAYEIVVADDASTDATAAIAAARGARVVSVAHRHIAATRNSGARAAAGEWLVFVDADTVVDAVVLAAAVQALRDGTVGGGAVVRFDGAVPLYARLLMPLVVFIFRRVRLAAGCFLFCTRAAFEAVGGFDERLFASEELTLSAALKTRGPFVVLSEVVVTSGRKLRSYSSGEILGILLRVGLRGRRGVRQRAGLELWYGERRPDPLQR